MQFIVNGQSQEHDAKTLAALLEAMGLADQKVATAVNGAFVPQTARADTALSEKDEIEILVPMQGG